MTELSKHARGQQALWGTDVEGWAAYAEPHTRPLFAAILEAARVGLGTRLLDVGCGSGLAMQLAAARGAEVTGLDISPALLGLAQRRLPDADLRLGDLQRLPFTDADFDVVIGVNSFQFAEDPSAALRDAARVVRPGGLVAASLFAEPERSQSTTVHEVMSGLSPARRQADHAPYVLSTAGNLEAAMNSAGLKVSHVAELAVDWAYADTDVALRGLLSSAGGARAIADAGRARAEEAIRGALPPLTRGDGRVVMHNVFRYVVACKLG